MSEECGLTSAQGDEGEFAELDELKAYLALIPLISIYYSKRKTFSLAADCGVESTSTVSPQ